MHGIDQRASPSGDRVLQRGVALLLALATTVALSLLALSVLASREASVKVDGLVDAKSRARQAAASGVEWGAAQALASSLVGKKATLVLGDGAEADVEIDLYQAPNVISDGRSGGVEVRVAANLAVTRAQAPSHAWVSLDGTLTLPADLTVQGSAYLGGSWDPIALLQPGRLRMHGNLLMQSTSLFSSYAIVHASGTTTRGVAAMAAPTTNVTDFPTVKTRGVDVAIYTGATTLADTTITGILRVNLANGQVLTLNRIALNGTLVVNSGMSWFSPARIRLADVTVNGGTAITGNLAILAPNAVLESSRSQVNGVSMVRTISNTDSTTLRGQVITGYGTEAKGVTIERPAGFVPDTPLGLSWGSVRCRVVWLADG
jgi:hypothetical protein